MTLSGLLGSDEAIDRPFVKVKLKGCRDSENFLYDSGAQVSLLSKNSFRKIPIKLRPKKITIDLTCSGVSGSKLRVMGCYFFKFKLLGRDVEHPFFVVDKIPGQKGVVGIDLIKKCQLSLDPVCNQPYFLKRNNATLTKDTFLPARSRTPCKIKIPPHCMKEDKAEKSLQILQVCVPTCAQVYVDELLIDPSEDGHSLVYLTNVSQNGQRLERGAVIGEVSAVEDNELTPFSVSSTTPLVNQEMLKKIQKKPPRLDDTRKRKIRAAANLDHLPENLKEKYLQLLFRNHECISLTEFDLGVCTKGAHAIPTKSDCPPVYNKQFPLPIEHEAEIRRQILEWLKIGIIRPCESEWNSSLFLVAKKAPPALPGEVGPRPKAYRIVQDLRGLNKETLPSNVRLPEIHECLDRIARKKPKVFSALDLRSGYFQLPIEKHSQEKTAFTSLSLGQQFCFKVTSQGLTSAPASFARTMQRIFNKQIARNDLEVYLDDVLTYSKNHDEMLKTLDEAFKNLIGAGMKINIDKCQFGIDKLTYLGFELDKDGYKPDPIKSEGITKVMEPCTLKGVRSFMGMANFYRLLIPKFAQLTKPLTRLTCKGVWSGGEMPESAKAAFKKCQSIFSNRPFLHYPDFNLKFHLYVDASLGDLDQEKEGGLAGCLVQYPNNDTTATMRPIGFCSRGLKKHEKSYSASLIETAGIIFSIEFFEKYLRTPFIVHTDHKPICTVREGKTHRRTLERFREILANYDFKLEFTPGSLMPSDFMSRHVKADSINCAELNALLTEKNDGAEFNETEKVTSACSACVSDWKVAQAGTNKFRQSSTEGLQPKTQSGSAPVAHSVPLQKSAGASDKSKTSALPSTKAEPKVAHIGGAGQAVPSPIACGDSQTKESESFHEEHKELHDADVLTASAQQIVKNGKQKERDVKDEEQKEVTHDDHEEKKSAVKKGIQIPLRRTLKDKIAGAIKFCIYEVSGKQKFKSFNLFDTSVDKNPTLLREQQKIDPFVQAFKYFVRDKVLPKDRYRNIIKRWGPYGFIKKGVVMVKHSRPGYPTRDLVVAPADRISDIIAEAHGSLLGGHDGMDKTTQRILGHYWFPGVHSETEFFIKNCSICQRNKKKEKTPNYFLKPLKQADQPFERIHVDLFGPMKTRDGPKYVQTMVDSFSKFGIFQVIPNKKAETVAQTLFDHWISIFGSPYQLISDRGTDFNTETMDKVCDYLQIDRKVIATQHPASNSQAEVLNKKLAKYFKAMETEGDLDWPALVNSCQYSYNLSVHKALKNSPYSVLFGVDANTPLNNKGFITHAIYGTKYQHKMGLRLKMAQALAKKNNMNFRSDYVKRFNKTVKPHEFKEGMLVLLHRPDLITSNPKIQSEWFGPFVILALVHKTNALIQDLANRKTKFVNVDRLRHYENSIKDWNKFKVILESDEDKIASAGKKKKGVSRSKQKVHDAQTATALQPTRFAEFSADNEIVCLNPDTTPVPKTAIKTEVVEEEEAVETDPSSNGSHFESFDNQESAPEPIHDLEPNLAPSTSKSTSTPKPPKQKATFSKAVLNMLSPKGPRTRGRVLDTNEYVPTTAESVRGLARAEKSKKGGKKKSTTK